VVFQLLKSCGSEPVAEAKFALDLSSAPEEQLIAGGPMFSPSVTLVFATEQVMVGVALLLLGALLELLFAILRLPQCTLLL